LAQVALEYLPQADPPGQFRNLDQLLLQAVAAAAAMPTPMAMDTLAEVVVARSLTAAQAAQAFLAKDLPVVWATQHLAILAVEGEALAQ
jgi:hypothetical protein